jgi:hypothetical protein
VQNDKVGLTDMLETVSARLETLHRVRCGKSPTAVTWHPLAGCQIRSHATCSKEKEHDPVSGEFNSQIMNTRTLHATSAAIQPDVQTSGLGELSHGHH